jgi:membrane fusion protein, multidrug efflux system
MKRITQIVIMAATTSFMVACNNSTKDANASVNDKKAELEKLKSEKAKNDDQIQKLQEELSKLDPNSDNSKIKLVAVSPVVKEDFKHYIDLQGKIDAENTSYIAPRTQGGQVKAIYVKQGDRVRKGQLLLKLDDAIQRQGVASARQQADVLKTQLALAKDLYKRQQNLFNEGIGTKVDMLKSETQISALENQIASVREGVKSAQEMLNTTNIYSDVTGVVDQLNVKVGEAFIGALPNGVPQIKVVNNNLLKAVANVPENYVSRLRIGTPVVVNVNDINKSYNSTVSFFSQSIDLTSRGFTMEAKIPTEPALRPNQSAVVKILDYSAPAAVVIPVNTVQSDEMNKYVYIMDKNDKGKTVARKKIIVLGEAYGNIVEIKSGLNGGEQLITEGYQNLYEGQLVGTDLK